MKSGIYIGEIVELKGERALLRSISEGIVAAQFDNISLQPYCYGWHLFNDTDFSIDPI